MNTPMARDPQTEALERIRLGEEPDSMVRLLWVERRGARLGPWLTPTPGLTVREAQGKPGQWHTLWEVAEGKVGIAP